MKLKRAILMDNFVNLCFQLSFLLGTTKQSVDLDETSFSRHTGADL
jgi:hypothetical protein